MRSGRIRAESILRTAAAAALTTALVTPLGAAVAAPARAASATTLPACPGVGAPRTLVANGGTYESAAFDTTGRLVLSNWLDSRIETLDRAGSTPRTLAEVPLPGGLAAAPDGSILVGAGNNPVTAALAPTFGLGRLVRLDPATGRTTTAAPGISMGNGVVRADDGTVYASDNVGASLDRIDPDGTVHRGWFRGAATNGLALSPDGTTLYATVSLGDARILAIDTRTARASVVPDLPAALATGFPDDLERDPSGRLYTPLYLAGQVLRIDPDGSSCTLATGLTAPAGVTLGHDGRGFSATSLYVTTHAGKILELPHALPAN